ncbi:MAG: glutamate--tRNA ligase [candidate division KSB1 bacterium]|nr:glutamate--tRNA ligase [candidate division KSB1 bacterium]
MSVRVRFAPSPTGKLHIGNARTAIMNWVFARHENGTFILRIEDTDVERSSEESERGILQDLHWLGLNWDEGPDVGGPHGPYRQSERLVIYREHAERLLQEGKAFYCYCTPDELEERKQKAIAEGRSANYDGRCRNLTEAERQAFEAEGRKPVIRFHVPEVDLSFDDIVRGEVTFPAGQIGDFIILRADGMPTYNFACVVDDGLMQITHVIRGDDHLSNTPKQIALYQAFGWETPHFAHIPMILGPDRTRLSKRHGATSVEEFAKHGYLPQALINYLSLLSWSSESGEEILSVQRLIDEFDFSRVSKSPAIFDVVKLNWMNGVYIRQMDVPHLTDLCVPYLKKAGYKLPDRLVLEKIIRVVQPSLEKLEDVIAKSEMFFIDESEPENEQAVVMLNRESTQKVFWSFLRQLDTIGQMTVEQFRKIMKVVSEETGVMGKDLWMPVRIALTGKMHGPDLPLVAEILGKEKCRRLIKRWVLE